MRDEAAQRSPRYLKRTAQFWAGLLLLLTRLWLLTACAQLLFWLLAAASRDTNHQPWF